MKRGKSLSYDPARAAERRARREARRAAEAPRPEDTVRELRQLRQLERDGKVKARMTVDEAADRRFWRQMVTKGGCVMCKAFPVDGRTRSERGADLTVIDGHHVVAKQDLKRWGLHARLWDIRNGIALCRYHHARHEAAMQRVPRELLPAVAWEFAEEINAEFVLDDDRVYPGQGAA